jgi:anaerobic selenocysteine-containing dehydrogenase
VWDDTRIDQVIRTTCPRDCYDACGVLVAVRDGKVRHVRGDPDHPIARGKLCRKCTLGYNGAWIDPEQRVTQPLRRTGPKGSGTFEPVSWDEALQECSERLGGVITEHGAASILNVHYTGTLGLVGYTFPMRLLGHMATTEVTPDTICNLAGHVALGYLYGTSETGFDPRTRDSARCILVWGANPSACGPHQDEHWLGEAQGTVVVIDPLETPTAARAGIHLQPRPGTDAALAFGLMHVIARDGLVDRDYVARHTTGFDELEPLLAGCTPEWTSACTGVPAADIERVARLYGAGPSLLWLGQGLQRQPNGGNVFRACATLPAITGNLGKPGAGFMYMNSGDRLGVDYDALVPEHLASSSPAISHMDLADVLADPERSRALVCWNMNIAASAPRQREVLAGLSRDDLFTLVVDPFPTDTARYADIVLPAATFLEHDDIVVPYFDLGLAAQVRAIDPPGEAMRNSEIFRRLAAAMGYDDPALFEPDEAIMERLIAGSDLVSSLDELRAAGSVYRSGPALDQFADGVFETPSGRIEIASAAAEADGHSRVPDPHADEPPADGLLRLLSPASQWTMNASFSNDRKVRGRLGVITVTVHPTEAARRGLVAGDPVRVTSDDGALTVQLQVGGGVPEGVALIPKGRWPTHEPGGANVNVLTMSRRTDMGESTAIHGTLVRIEALPEAVPVAG